MLFPQKKPDRDNGGAKMKQTGKNAADNLQKPVTNIKEVAETDEKLAWVSWTIRFVQIFEACLFYHNLSDDLIIFFRASCSCSEQTRLGNRWSKSQVNL